MCKNKEGDLGMTEFALSLCERISGHRNRQKTVQLTGKFEWTTHQYVFNTRRHSSTLAKTNVSPTIVIVVVALWIESNREKELKDKGDREVKGKRKGKSSVLSLFLIYKTRNLEFFSFTPVPKKLYFWTRKESCTLVAEVSVRHGFLHL